MSGSVSAPIRIHVEMANAKTDEAKKKTTKAKSSSGDLKSNRPAKSAAVSAATRKKSAAQEAKPRPKKPTKDPQGGLTAEGRKMFARKEGSHLKPGVKGPADTPEKMRRKGSFLRRHFAHPRGPMERDGEPTRLALSAHAWGERVPKTSEDASKLAAKGKVLLARYKKSEVKAKKS